MSPPADSGRPQLTERLVVDLGAAFQQRAVYAAGHPQVERAVGRALDSFVAWCRHEEAAEVSLLTLEGQLLVDRQAIPDDSPWARGLLQAFRRYEIGGLTLLAGLDATELREFFESCRSEKGASATAHILVGRAGLAAGDAAVRTVTVGTAGRGAPQWLSAEQMAEVRAELVGAATGRVSRVDRLRALVSRLARSAESGAIEPLEIAPADIDDHAFLHGLAVALATLRLGRALGLAGEALEELGFAGFVHDIGFLEPAPDGESPAERRERHPIRGAARLAALEGLPDSAVLVAYEHHLRFDRLPNYPPTPTARAPLAAARVVAVADTWVTLRSRGELPAGEAIALLRSRAGTFLDPALVELFAALLEPPAG